jgi:hypothetical protein
MVVARKDVATASLEHVKLLYDRLNLRRNLSRTRARPNQSNTFPRQVRIGRPFRSVPLLALKVTAAGNIGVFRTVEAPSIVEKDVRNPLRLLARLSILYEDFPQERVLIPASLVNSRIEERVLLKTPPVGKAGIILLNMLAIGELLGPVFVKVSRTEYHGNKKEIEATNQN